MKYVIYKASDNWFEIFLHFENTNLQQTRSIYETNDLPDAIRLCSELNAMLDGKAHQKDTNLNVNIPE